MGPRRSTAFADLARRTAPGSGCCPAPRCCPRGPRTRGGRARCRTCGTSARRGVRRRVVVHRAGHRHAGLPALAARPAGRARRHGHPDQPRRAAEGRPEDVVVNCSGHRRPAAGARPRRAAGARPGGAPRAGRAGPLVARRRRSDVRRPAQPRHRGRRHRRATATGAAPRPRRPRPRSSSARPAWCPSWPAPRVAHRVGCARCGRRYGWRRRAGVVHCYGQGGAGVTLCWGCADEVATLVEGPEEPRRDVSAWRSSDVSGHTPARPALA